tara:strand:- start:360 stop:623 length:264 start_codon:yes stop_codon:yes gene_type:complete
LDVFSEISILHLTKVQQILNVEQHHLGGRFGYPMRSRKQLCLAQNLLEDRVTITQDLFFGLAQQVNNVFEVSLGSILLHYNTVKRVP